MNTSETPSTDVVERSTTLQRPVKDANQPETLPKATASTTGEASSLTLSEQTGQVSMSMSGASNQASSNSESELRVSGIEVVEKRRPKHKNR